MAAKTAVASHTAITIFFASCAVGFSAMLLILRASFCLGSPNDERPRTASIHRVVLGYDPLAVFVFGGDSEQFFVGGAGAALALAAIVEDDERRGFFPLHQLPGDERVLRLGGADVAGIFLVIIALPVGQQLVAVAVANGVQEFSRSLLGGAVAQRIHLDADGQAAERVALFRPRQHRSLIAEPPHVPQKHRDQQDTGADGNADLCASEGHYKKFMEMTRETARLPPEDPERTCTSGGMWRGHSCPRNLARNAKASCFRTLVGLRRQSVSLLVFRFRGLECPRHSNHAKQTARIMRKGAAGAAPRKPRTEPTLSCLRPCPCLRRARIGFRPGLVLRLLPWLSWFRQLSWRGLRRAFLSFRRGSSRCPEVRGKPCRRHRLCSSECG